MRCFDGFAVRTTHIFSLSFPRGRKNKGLPGPCLPLNRINQGWERDERFYFLSTNTGKIIPFLGNGCLWTWEGHFPRFAKGVTQLLVEALIFMSWRAAVGGEAIPKTVEETASAVYDRLAAT